MSLLLSFVLGAAAFHVHRFFPLTTAAFAAAASLFCLYKTLASGLSFIAALRYGLLAAAAAAAFLYARAFHMPVHPPDQLAGERLVLEVRPRSEAIRLTGAEPLFSQVVHVKAAEDSHGTMIYLHDVRLLTGRPLAPDSTYHVEGYVSKDSVFLNPGSGAQLLRVRGEEVSELQPETTAAARVRAFFERARARINRQLKEHFSEAAASFLMSQVTGERGYLSAETREAFNASGLAHILSISGTHFGLLMLFLFALFRALFRRLPYAVLVLMTNYITPSQTAAVFSLPFVAAYLGISDMSVPAVRSFVMITLFLLGLLLQRRGFWLNALLFAACLLLIVDPGSLADLSFQLSFIAVLCIGAAAHQGKTEAPADATDDNGGQPAEDPDMGDYGISKRLKRLLSPLRAALVVSLAATAGTAPLVAYHFHYLSLISPLSNLVITPLVGFVLLPIALCSSFIFLLTGYFPFEAILEAMVTAALSLISLIAEFRFAAIAVPAFPPVLLGTFYFGLLLCVHAIVRGGSDGMLRKRHGAFELSAGVAVALLPLVLYWGGNMVSPRALSVTYLDVGQGDASVVELPDGRTFVIDAGKTGRQVTGFLRYRGIRKIDALIVSHGQTDHAGGLVHLMETFPVSEVWHNGLVLLPRDVAGYALQRSLQRGDVIRGEGYKVVVLHPYEGFYTMDRRGDEANNASLVIRIEGHGQSFLFPGDTEAESEEDLVHLDGALKSTVMKVPHHGSASSLSSEILALVSPDIAVISLGRRNIFDFPHEETLLKLRSVRTFRTDRDGAVRVTAAGNGALFVRTWKDSQLTEATGLADEVGNFRRVCAVW